MADPSERDLQDLRRLLRKAGSRERFIQWLDQCQPSKRGRRSNDPFKDFSVSTGPEKGVYVVRYKMDGNAYVVVVKAHKRRIGNRPELIVSTPHQTFRTIAKEYGHGQHSIDAFAKKLEKKFSKKLGELKDTFQR